MLKIKKLHLKNQLFNRIIKCKNAIMKVKKASETNLYHVVKKIIRNKKNIFNLVKKYPTPFYVFDQESLECSADSFLSSFKRELGSFKPYYALKINHHPYILKSIVKKGYGLDVGSPREIEMAIDAGCKDILYFSPGKTISDLKHALRYSSLVTINMDSFSELEKLGELTNKSKIKIKAGVRIHTDLSGDWKKYGIHLKNFKKFLKLTENYPFIDFCGIHFHMSRNPDATFYEMTIKEVGQYLKGNLNEFDLQKIKYIDFGGGFEVNNAEGIIKKGSSNHDYLIRKSEEIDQYAKRIAKAAKKYIDPVLQVTYYSEPGRVICNDAMFIVMTVADKKDNNNVILDGGVNMVGWQRFEYEYFPLIDLNSPSKKEIKCNLWGNLCTTWDIWGYRCYSRKIKEGNIIVVPNQGSLTFSLAQNFIQTIPPVYKL